MRQGVSWQGKLKRVWGVLLVSMMILMLAASLVSYGYFGLEDMDSVTLFNVGYGLMAMLLSIVLVACCFLDETQKSKSRLVFLLLIFVNYCIMALENVSFFLDGKPEYREFHMISMAVAFMLDYMVFYLFVVSLITILGLQRETGVRVVLAVFGIITLGFAVSAIVNYWTPVYYIVDEAGIYHRTLLHDATFLFKLAVSALIYILILVYNRRLKITQIATAAALGFALDILALSDMFIPGLDVCYPVILLLLFLMYVMFNLRSGDKTAAKKAELDTARTIQSSILPKLFPEHAEVPEYDIYARMSPARDRGEDFYDFFMVDKKRFAVLIGDVSSGDVDGALFMEVCKSLIHMRSRMGGTPAEVLMDVNDRITRSDCRSMKARVWLGFLDIETGRMMYSHAGMSRQALKEKESISFRYQEYEETPSLGEEAGTEYTDGEMTLLPGERIFFFTEGIPLSRDRDGKEFGYDRILRVLDDNQRFSNEELCMEMQKELEFCLGTGSQTLDITMMGFTYKGGKNAPKGAAA